MNHSHPWGGCDKLHCEKQFLVRPETTSRVQTLSTATGCPMIIAAYRDYRGVRPHRVPRSRQLYHPGIAAVRRLIQILPGHAPPSAMQPNPSFCTQFHRVQKLRSLSEAKLVENCQAPKTVQILESPTATRL